jgi:hypothetical protein
MCEQIRTRTRHWTMLRYWVLVFSIESKLENKLVVSLSCRLGIARDTKVWIIIKKKWVRTNSHSSVEVKWIVVGRHFSLKTRPQFKTHESLGNNKNMVSGFDRTQNQDLLCYAINQAIKESGAVELTVTARRSWVSCKPIGKVVSIEEEEYTLLGAITKQNQWRHRSSYVCCSDSDL